MKNNTELYKEAKLIGKYLIDEDIQDNICHDYVDAINIKNEGEDKTQRFLDKAVNSNWKLKYYDAAFAFGKNKTTIRRKIFIMLAILEASPDYFDKFLEKEKPMVKMIFTIFFHSFSIIISFAIGKIIIYLNIFNKKQNINPLNL